MLPLHQCVPRSPKVSWSLKTKAKSGATDPWQGTSWLWEQWKRAENLFSQCFPGRQWGNGAIVKADNLVRRRQEQPWILTWRKELCFEHRQSIESVGQWRGQHTMPSFGKQRNRTSIHLSSYYFPQNYQIFGSLRFIFWTLRVAKLTLRAKFCSGAPEPWEGSVQILVFGPVLPEGRSLINTVVKAV